MKGRPGPPGPFGQLLKATVLTGNAPSLLPTSTPSLSALRFSFLFGVTLVIQAGLEVVILLPQLPTYCEPFQCLEEDGRA